MNFEIIHPKTGEFFSEAKRPLEIIALAVSGRHPEPRQCFAYIDCTLSYKRILSEPAALSLLALSGFTDKYGIGKEMKCPQWSMLETLDLQKLKYSRFVQHYPYRTALESKTRHNNQTMPYWIDKYGTGKYSGLNESIPVYKAPALTGRSPRDITEYLKQVLKPSDAVSNYLLNIDSIVETYMEPVRKHNKRMKDLRRKNVHEHRNRDSCR